MRTAFCRRFALAICLCLPFAAVAQTLLPPVHHKAPAHPAPKLTHKPVKPPVPVLTPHHAGPPRHTPHPSPMRRPTYRHETPKPLPPPAVVKPVPKKLAPPTVPADVGTVTGLHLPRYAALKSDEVNMRSGPGERYPVLWTYQRRDLPVKIEREFDIWRLVEDMDGIKGWMQQGTITGRRSFIITGTDDRNLRADANDTADLVAILKPGVIGRIKSCEAGKSWCQVQVQDYRGWLKREDFWGTDPDEIVAP